MKKPDHLSSILNLDPDIARHEQDTWTRVGIYPDLSSAHEHTLVVLSMGMPCWLEGSSHNAQYILLVSPEDAERACQELRQYDNEAKQNSSQAPAETGTFTHSPGWIAYLLWAAILAIAHQLQQNHPLMTDLGASSSTDLILDGQWWRPFTALFLHADFEHLMGNLLSGLFFATLVSSSIGAWRAWLLILSCGTMGNALTSLLTYPDPYRSIGASTAVFSALGILSGLGLAWMLRFRSQVPWMRISAPLIGGIVVLGMTGSGLPDSNTDVMGHVFGFAAGVVVGVLFGSIAETINHTAKPETSKEEPDAPT